MKFGENVKTLRLDRNLSQLDLGHAVGVTDRAVSRWENGKMPRMGKLQQLAELFEVPVVDLVEGDITQYLRSEVVRLRARATRSDAPLYATIAAGVPIEQTPTEGRVPVPENVLADHPNAFFLRVSGESMNRVLPNGYYALVDPDAEISNGDVVALNINGHEATVKRYYRGASSVTLMPDSWDDRECDLVLDYTKPDTDEVRLIGLVVLPVAPYGRKL